MNYHNQETSYRSLQGPRPFQQNIGYTPRQPRKPLMVRVPPTRKELPPQQYHYPPPRPYERRESKIEVDLTDEPLSPVSSVPSLSKTATDSDEEDIVSPKAVIETKHSKKLPPRPNSEPKEATKRLVHVSSFNSYSDDEDEDEINDEAILQELSLSRKKSVHDITISDDEDKEEEEDDSDSTYDEIYPSSSLQRSESTHTQKNGLPPIPVISAPDDVPSIPILCVPDQEQPKTTPQKKNDRLLSSIFFGGIRCDGCDQPLSGQAITTSGKRWHTHCFQCQACHQNLEHIAFYEKEGLPYCALDYHELFSPRCDFCKTPIEEHSISAIGKTYHPGHFFCRECGKPFDEETDFLEHEGHAYCERDYYKQFGKKCRGCEETITGDFLVALGGDWHKECFVCADCGCTFTSSTFLIRSGKPYCELHHAARMSPSSSTLSSKSSRVTSMRSALPQFDLLPDIKPLEETKPCKSCHRCQKPIEGRSISAFGYDYHPLHFQCAQCNKILSVRLPGLYQETEKGNIICKPCIRKNKTS